MKRIAFPFIAALACSGCWLRSTANAPGVVHLERAPLENGDPAFYVPPEDPGEHELYVAPSLVFGPGAGPERPYYDNASFELGVQLRLAYSTLDHSRRKKDVPMPRPGWGMTLGWMPLQFAPRILPPGGGTVNYDAFSGPLYVEVERQFYLLSAGAGPVYYPGGEGGGQITLAARPYGIRFRYTADGGFEVWAAFQLELPGAINWSR